MYTLSSRVFDLEQTSFVTEILFMSTNKLSNETHASSAVYLAYVYLKSEIKS